MLPASSLKRATPLLVVVAVAAAFGWVVLVGGARSAGRASGLIAFTRADGIYVMQTDGTGVRPLRHGGTAAGAVDLVWSPDGRKLAFAARSGIWVMNADGTHLVRLVDARPGWALSLTWSSDGRRLAYATFQARGQIWVMNADGSGKRLLAGTSRPRLYMGTAVDWSPAVDRIAFTTGGWTSDLYVMNATGSGLHRLAAAGRLAYTPRWSPDGRRIAFTNVYGANGEEIAVIVAHGEEHARMLTSNDVLDSEPSWSSDGSRIAFVRGKDEQCSFGNCPPTKRSTHEIYVMNADGTNLRRLTNNKIGEASPAWQPTP